MKKIYPYVNKTRANADGSFSVFVIIKGTHGRFFVNTGMTTCDRLVDRSFPKADANWKRKTILLGKYIAAIEAICLNADIAGYNDNELKRKIQQDVFGVEKHRTCTLTDIIRKFGNTKQKKSTRDLYAITAKMIADFDESANLDVDSNWLEVFYSHMREKGSSINYISIHMCNIRSAFNWARQQGITDNYPFLSYRIKKEYRKPNNISVENLRKLRDYPCELWQKRYVDFFFLSFYLAGINPVDLLFLKKDSYKDGYISFVRRKTDKENSNSTRVITLPVLPEAKEIIDRYPSKEGWLLNFMDGRTNYRGFTHIAVQGLQRVGPWEIVKDKVGKMRKVNVTPICPNITLYSARYSFGSIAANDLDISERTIGMCLGHSWTNNVTSRYIAHDQKKVDNAIRRVVDFLKLR